MDIGFRYIGHFKIDDVFKIVNINTTCGNISRDEDTGILCFKIFQCALTGILCFVSMYRLRSDMVLLQNFDHFVGTMLCPRKNQSRFYDWIS